MRERKLGELFAKRERQSTGPDVQRLRPLIFRFTDSHRQLSRCHNNQFMEFQLQFLRSSRHRLSSDRCAGVRRGQHRDARKPRNGLLYGEAEGRARLSM